MKNPYFDLHIHTSLKHFLTLNRKGKRRNGWKRIPHWSSPANGLIPGIRSQSCLGQLAQANIHTAVVSLYALEQPIAEATSRFGLPLFFTPFTRHFINQIAKMKFTYFELLQKEMEFLLKESEKGGTRVLRQGDAFAHDAVNLILSIEGGHSLMGGDETSIMANLQRLKQSEFRFLYLTLTHLTRSPLSNHAFGMKKVMGKMVLEPAFLPGTVGLSQMGKEVIRTALDQKQGQRIFIDVKHMSLQARKEFYEMRRSEGFEDVPIVASHCAATGFAHQDLALQIDPSQSSVEGDYVKLTYLGGKGKVSRPFNPWSLNLYDEDIREIITSGGLIGLSLDERVLGGTRNGEEYFYAKEFELLFPRLFQQIRDREVAMEPLAAGWVLPKPKARLFRSRNQLYYLAHNILHMVRVGGPQTWEHLCLGSDFDGLIKPINRCRSILAYHDLEQGASRDLASAIQGMALADPAFGEPIPGLKEKVRGIMFENARRFLEKHF